MDRELLGSWPRLSTFLGYWNNSGNARYEQYRSDHITKPASVRSLNAIDTMHSLCRRLMLMYATVIEVLRHERTYEHYQKAMCDEPDGSPVRHSTKVSPPFTAWKCLFPVHKAMEK